MFISKGISAIAAVVMGTAVVFALPAFTPNAEAVTPAPVLKSDRLDIRPLGKACSQQAWPYYETQCLRDRTRVSGEARSVRLVTTDQFSTGSRLASR